MRTIQLVAWGLLLAALLALSVLLVVPRAAHGQQSPADSIARGEIIAQRMCARCHAVGRSGASPNAKAPPFREIGRNYPLEHLGEAFAEGIVTGDNDMPEFKFGPQDVDAILDYLAAMAATR